jgi:hypothetical protein
LKENVVKAFDMLVVETNILLIIDIDDYPQKLNKIVESRRA